MHDDGRPWSWRRPHTAARRWCWGLVMLFSVCQAQPSLTAAELADTLTGYTLTSWTQRDGLPFGAVRAAVQDGPGFLWLATDYGLVRFDGSHFATWEELGGTPLPHPRVRSLVRSRDDSLWIGLEEGGVCKVSQINRVVRCDGPGTAGPAGAVLALLEDRDGVIWAGGRDGLFGRVDGRWQKVHADAFGRVTSLGQANQRLLVGADRGLFEYDRQRQTWRQLSTGAAPRDVVAGPSGEVYVTDFSRGFRRVGDDGRAPFVAAGRGVSLLFDRGRNFWVGTLGQGLWRIDAASRRVEFASALTGLPSDGVLSIFEDRDGNIWAGTSEGLTRLSRQVAKQITGLGLVRAVLADTENVWVAAADTLYRYRSSDITRPTAKISLGSAIFRAIHRTSEGVILVATDAGLARLERGQLHPIAETSRLQEIAWIAGDTRRDVWLFDVRDGLWRWRDKVLSRPRVSWLRDATVTSEHTDAEGRVWIATAGDQVVMLRPHEEPSVFGQRQGLPKGPFLAITDAATDSVWVAGDRAIARFQDGHFLTMGFSSPLLQQISSIVFDEQETLWMATLSGVFQIRKTDYEESLRSGTEPLYTRFDRWDGMAGMPSPMYGDTGRAAVAANGTVWFVTARGVSVIDPAQLDGETSEVVSSIYRVTLDGTESLAPTETLTFPSSVRKVTIRYTAIDLSPSKRRFRHRLDGFDEAWIDGAKERAAQYTNLSPGAYTFRVQVSDAKGVWGNETSLGLTVRPPFYQSTTFIIWCSVGVAAAIALAWLVQLRRVHASYAIAAAERARMGREIHDTLLQGLVGVALQLDAMVSEVEEGPLVNRLVHLRHCVEGYVGDARESILNLRSTGVNDNLAKLLRKEALISSGQLPIEFTVSGEPYSCAQFVTDELLKVCREAVLNAWKHSEGSKIRVALTYHPRSISLMVADDGHGFDWESVSTASGHYGFVGMAERAQLLGGRFEVVSLPGAGTCIEVVVPMRRIRWRQWFQREKLTLAEG